MTKQTPGSDKDRVLIFDTTLRDGEQCPGASMNFEEKLQVAELSTKWASTSSRRAFRSPRKAISIPCRDREAHKNAVVADFLARHSRTSIAARKR